MQRSIPVWVRAVLVLLALGTVRAWLPEPVPAEVLVRARELRAERDPRRMSQRELRQLPGVGHRLALALVAARDDPRAEELAWEDVPGIGEVRAREIRAWCHARGIEPDPLRAGRGRGFAGTGYPVDVARVSFVMRLCLALALGACRDAASAGGGAPVPDPFAPTVPGAEAPAVAGASAVRVLALQGGALHALEAGPGKGVLVLLLHGARYSAGTWRELGTLELLAHAGYHALAIDWPGYGATPAWGAEPDPGTLLASLCDELGAERVVLVAPSLGGRFAFEFLRSSAARVAALVAIAPAGAAAIYPETWSTPTLLLWGERDEIVPVADGQALAGRLGGARLEILSGASHPCYLDQPERFHALLLEFLGGVVPGPERGR